MMKNDDNIEDGKAQPPQETAAANDTAAPPRKRQMWIILIGILILLAVAGLVIGLILGLDDDDDDNGGTGLDLECITDTDEMHELSPALENYEMNQDWMECTFDDNSAYCTVEEPASSITTYTQICEDVGGQIFFFDDAKLRCNGNIAGVGKVTITMNFVSFTECFASSCEVLDDEAFERAAMNFIGSMVADDDEDISHCKYLH